MSSCPMAPYGITYLVKILILIEYDLIISSILMPAADVMVYNILTSFTSIILTMKITTSLCGDIYAFDVEITTSPANCPDLRNPRVGSTLEKSRGVGSLCVQYLFSYLFFLYWEERGLFKAKLILSHQRLCKRTICNSITERTFFFSFFVYNSYF